MEETVGLIVWCVILGMLCGATALAVAWVVAWFVSRIKRRDYPRRLFHVLAVLLGLIPFCMALLTLPLFWQAANARSLEPPAGTIVMAVPLMLCLGLVVLCFVVVAVIIDARRARRAELPS